MSDQIDFDDNEYVWPVGDVPGVPADQLVPPMPASVTVTDVDFGKMWAAYTRLQALLGGSADATLLDRAADEIERLRQEIADVNAILDVAMDTASKTL